MKKKRAPVIGALWINRAEDHSRRPTFRLFIQRLF